LKAGANAILTFERLEDAVVRRSLGDHDYQQDRGSYYQDSVEALDEGAEWGQIVTDRRLVTETYERAKTVVETLELSAYLTRDKEASTDKTPRSFDLQSGPNTDVFPLKGYCVNPKLLPDWVRFYSRAKCVYQALNGQIFGTFVVTWPIQSPWKPVQKAMGTKIHGQLLITGPGRE